MDKNPRITVSPAGFALYDEPSGLYVTEIVDGRTIRAGGLDEALLFPSAADAMEAISRYDDAGTAVRVHAVMDRVTDGKDRDRYPAHQLAGRSGLEGQVLDMMTDRNCRRPRDMSALYCLATECVAVQDDPAERERLLSEICAVSVIADRIQEERPARHDKSHVKTACAMLCAFLLTGETARTEAGCMLPKHPRRYLRACQRQAADRTEGKMTD